MKMEEADDTFEIIERILQSDFSTNGEKEYVKLQLGDKENGYQTPA
jgi:hypothetical protein